MSGEFIQGPEQGDRGLKDKQTGSPLLETNACSSLVLPLTVSTPPAISSVMLALMSSMDSLSRRSRLAKTPGYFFEGPVS